MDDLLLRMNADESDVYTDVGEQIALRIDRLADQADGTLHVINDYDINGNYTGTYSFTINDFMPGAEADFLVPVTPVVAEDLSRWSGTYVLSATVKKFQFRMSTDAEGDRFGAALGTDAQGNDRYSFYRVGENGEALPPTNSEADDILNLFNPYPKQNERVFDQKDTRMNLTRQNALKGSNRAWALSENNDYELELRQFFKNGEEYAEIRLSNETLKAAKDITPMLVTKYTYLDEVWRNTGWHKELTNVDINSGFTRTLVVPMKELANGVRYEQLRLEITNAANPGSEASYYEINDASNRAELILSGNFTFLEQPKSMIVPEEQTAVFTCRVTGDNAPYTYQWQVRYPNGEYRTLSEATESTLLIDKISKTDTGNVYWCIVSDADGRSIMSEQATLIVTEKIPETGDPNSPVKWAVICGTVLLLLLLLIFTNGRKRSER